MSDRIPLEHASIVPELPLGGRVPLQHDPLDLSTNGNGAIPARRHRLRRGGLVTDLVRYPYLEMRKVSDHFLVPLPEGVPLHALQLHVGNVCKQMSLVLAANGYGKSVLLRARSEPENKGVRVRRVS